MKIKRSALGSLVAEIVFANLLGSKSGAEHVTGFGEVVGGAVIEADFDLVIVEAIHVFTHFDVGNEIAGFLERNAIMLGKFLQFLLLTFFADGFVKGLHLEDVAIDKVAAEERKDGVRMVAPYFHG